MITDYFGIQTCSSQISVTHPPVSTPYSVLCVKLEQRPQYQKHMSLSNWVD